MLSKIIILIVILTLIILIGCPIYNIFGLYCPGCGITRMIIALMKFEIYQAFRYNPLLFIYLIITILYITFKILNPRYNNKKIFNIVIYVMIVVALVFGIIRNIPMFSFLQPTII